MENVPETAEQPTKLRKRAWTFERRLAAGIVGALAFEGELDDSNADDM